MSENSRTKRIISWKHIPTEEKTSGDFYVEREVVYNDNSIERKNVYRPPRKDSHIEQGGKASLADILSHLDKEMKEKVKKEEQGNKDEKMQ